MRTRKIAREKTRKFTKKWKPFLRLWLFLRLFASFRGQKNKAFLTGNLDYLRKFAYELHERHEKIIMVLFFVSFVCFAGKIPITA